MITKLYLPNLLEYVYDSIIKKGFPFLFERLDRVDFLKVRSHSKARDFAENRNLEEKMLLMSKLDMGCCVFFWDKANFKGKRVQDVVMAYVDVPDNDLAKQMVKDKVFASMDINFIRSLQNMSKAGNSRVYAVNRKFYEIRKNSEAFTTRRLTQNITTEKNLDWYAQTILFGLELAPALEAYRLNMVQFRILLYLYTLPNGATKDHLLARLGRSNITGMLQKMDVMNMIRFDGKTAVIEVYGLMVLEQIFGRFP